VKIIITGSAQAIDAECGVPVDDALRLAKLDGLAFDNELCATYIEDGPLADIGLEGGLIRLAYRSSWMPAAH
jgi:hypothetical protein